MSDFLGFVELILWIVSVIAIAAAITYTVVRFAPKGRDAKRADTGSASDST